MSKLGKKLIAAMKDGQTYHEFNCSCDFCKAGDTRHPMKCQATFKEHCQYPKCDCDRPVTAAVINSTEFPRLQRILEEDRAKRLAEYEAKLAGPYVGGMTEYWQRCKDFLLSQKGQEIADVLDGPDQECYPIDDSAYTAKMYPDDGDFYVTDPQHGGKVTCHKCNGFIMEKDDEPYWEYPDKTKILAHFHKDCYNNYEHYYGLDKPID